MRWIVCKKAGQTVITNFPAIGISLDTCSRDDMRIQSSPIATRQSSRDTSNHFQRNSQQPENNQWQRYER